MGPGHPQDDGRDLEVQFPQQVAQQPHHGHDADIHHAAVHRVDTHDAEQEDRRIEDPIGNPQEVHEDPHQGEIEQEQHQIPHVHAGDQPPENRRLLLDEQRPWLGPRDHAKAAAP
jgi:hypothetical protein